LILQPITDVRPVNPGEEGEMKVVPVALGVVSEISQIRLYLPSDLRPLEARKSVAKSIEEVIRRFPDGVPILDPIEDMKIKDRNFVELVKNIKRFEKRLDEHALNNDPDVAELYNSYSKKVKVRLPQIWDIITYLINKLPIILEAL
jgi:ATP-dependent RNA helicase DOB1